MVHAEDVVRKVIDVDSQDYYHVLCLAITVAHEACQSNSRSRTGRAVRAISDKGPTAVPKPSPVPPSTFGKRETERPWVPFMGENCGQ